MATSSDWFDETHYLQSKLAQLRATDPDNPAAADVAALRAALEAAGYTPLQHFEAFGAQELTSPNPYFNATEYLEAKARQLNNSDTEPRTDWTAQEVAQAFQNAGVTPWMHFQQIGWAEGVNPSNAFDVGAYFENKLAQLQEADPDAGWTLESVQAAFADAGTDPISHYLQTGVTEGVEVVEVPADEQVPSDGRDLDPDPGEPATLIEALDNLEAAQAARAQFVEENGDVAAGRDAAEAALAAHIAQGTDAQLAARVILAEADLAAAQEAAADVSAEDAELVRAHATAQATVATAGMAVASAQADVDAATAELAAAQSGLDDARAERDTAQTAAFEAREARVNAEAALIAAQKAEASTQSDLEAAQDAFNAAEADAAAAQSDVDAAENGVASTQTALTTAQADLADAEGELETAQTGLDDAQAAFASAEADLAAAQGVFDTAQEDLNTAQEASNSAQADLTAAEGALDASNAAINEFFDTGAGAEFEDADALRNEQQRIDALRTQYENALPEEQETFFDEGSPGAEFADAGELGSRDDALTGLVDGLLVLEGARDDAQAEVATAQAAFDTAQGELAAAQASFDTAGTELAAAQTAFDTASDNRDAAQSAVDTATANRATAQGAVDAAAAAHTAAQATLTSAEGALAAAGAVLADAQATLDTAQQAFDDAGTDVTEAQGAFDAAVAAETAAGEALTQAEADVTEAEGVRDSAASAQESAQAELALELENQAEAQSALDEAAAAVAAAEISDEDIALVEQVVAAETALANAQGMVQERAELREGLADADELVAALQALDEDVDAAVQVLEDMGYGAPQVVEGEAEVGTEANDIFLMQGDDGVITDFSAGDLLFVGEGYTLAAVEEGADLNGAGTAGSVTDREIFVQQDGADTVLWIEAESFAGNDKTGEFDGNIVRLEGVDATQVTIELAGFVGVNDAAAAVPVV